MLGRRRGHERKVNAPGSPEQLRAYFATFGAVVVPGLFAAEIASIIDGYEAVFASEPSEAVDPALSLHKAVDPAAGAPRHQIVGTFIEHDDRLRWLRDEPRIVDLAKTLLGADCRYGASTGNIFNSYISWHSDYFRMAIPDDRRIKFAFYLDALDRSSGALRIIPGTNHFGVFRSELFDEAAVVPADHLARKFGVADDELPYWPLEVQPGDVVIFDNATLHASFGGTTRRRMFSLQFIEAASAERAAIR